MVGGMKTMLGRKYGIRSDDTLCALRTPYSVLRTAYCVLGARYPRAAERQSLNPQIPSPPLCSTWLDDLP